MGKERTDKAATGLMGKADMDKASTDLMGKAEMSKAMADGARRAGTAYGSSMPHALMTSWMA